MLDELITREELAGLLEMIAAELRHGTVSSSAPDSLPGDSDPSSTTPHSPATSTSGTPHCWSASQGLRSWNKVGELHGQSYTWPTGTEEYDPFEVWETNDEGAALQFGLGYVAANPQEDYYGRPRGYWLAFVMVNGQKRRPIGVFIEADQPTDLVAVIKGKGHGGRSMYAPGDELPAGYDGLNVDVFRDRVTGPQAYNRLAVVAKNGDRQTMLNHAAIQSTLRV